MIIDELKPQLLSSDEVNHMSIGYFFLIKHQNESFDQVFHDDNSQYDDLPRGEEKAWERWQEAQCHKVSEAIYLCGAIDHC